MFLTRKLHNSQNSAQEITQEQHTRILREGVLDRHPLLKNFMDPLEVVKKHPVWKIGVFGPLFCLGMLRNYRVENVNGGGRVVKKSQKPGP